MRAGRNDPCPCGSGKKYKKCCLAKDQEESSRQVAAIEPSPSSAEPTRTDPSMSAVQAKLEAAIAAARDKKAAARDKEPKVPAKPRDPAAEKAESLWLEFKSQAGEDRIAIFHKALEDDEVMDDELAFEMLSILHQEAVKSGDRRGSRNSVRLPSRATARGVRSKRSLLSVVVLAGRPGGEPAGGCLLPGVGSGRTCRARHRHRQPWHGRIWDITASLTFSSGPCGSPGRA